MKAVDERSANDASTSARLPPPVATRVLVFYRQVSVSSRLPERGTIVVGRGREADLRLDDPSVSRKHAALHLGAAVRIEDLGSANGTRIDGRTVLPGSAEPVVLGAIVELGEVRLVLCRERSVTGEAAMARLRELVARVAPSDVSVILVGETGVGKEVLAEAIHRESKRALGPFLRLNCAAVPDSLIESELFGHEAGAFTGATRAKVGLLEAAQRGSVLLDEVAELPLAMQAKLLRVLENREVRPVGSVRPRPLDVRFMAATHRDLDLLVALGRFRQDLAFRLNGITIQVPPLRERISEVASLARAFVAGACERSGRSQLDVSPESMLLLESYRWPGNVRELRNVVERAVLLCTGHRIELENLTFGGPGASSPSSSPPIGPSAAAPELATGDGASDTERQRIAAALDRCGGNQTEAAKLLGMSRRMLRYRIEKLDLPRPRKRSSRER